MKRILLILMICISGLLIHSPTQAEVEVWGDTGIKGYFGGEKMAPNGSVYNPLFSLNLNLNIGERECFYIFYESAFWAQKAEPGIVTNKKQGKFDFSKRQFDLKVGAAFWIYKNIETRAFLYSFNNINRGKDLYKPYGFKDGFGIESRYHFNKRNSIGVGYYFTKEMVDQKGDGFSPGLLATVNLNYDLFEKPEKFYLFVKAECITSQSHF